MQPDDEIVIQCSRLMVLYSLNVLTLWVTCLHFWLLEDIYIFKRFFRCKIGFGKSQVFNHIREHSARGPNSLNQQLSCFDRVKPICTLLPWVTFWGLWYGLGWYQFKRVLKTTLITVVGGSVGFLLCSMTVLPVVHTWPLLQISQPLCPLCPGHKHYTSPRSDLSP